LAWSRIGTAGRARRRGNTRGPPGTAGRACCGRALSGAGPYAFRRAWGHPTTAPWAALWRFRSDIEPAGLLRRSGRPIQRDRSGPDGKARRSTEIRGAAAEAPPSWAGVVVGCGSLADGHHSHESIGGKPRPVPAHGRDRPQASSSLGSHVAVSKGLAARALLRRKVLGGTQWGQHDGPEGPTSPRRRRETLGVGRGLAAAPLPRTTLPLGACGPPAPRRHGGAGGEALTIVTWLILPVVICLSQRLSHACLSISNYTVKLRMAH
jgi:hypothetical protein